MTPSPIPLVLLFGPAGSGKTTLATHLSKTLGWVHLDTDPFSSGNDHRAWLHRMDAALASHDGFQAFAGDLRRHAAGLGSSGAVLTFISLTFLDPEQARRAREAGLSALYLHGEEDECLRAFLSREALIGRNLGEGHWHMCNRRIIEALREPGYDPYKLAAFREGRHKPLQELADEVGARCLAREVP